MTPAAPSGVVTFLFTDIEGSTRRWESDAEAMRSALVAHDDVLRSAIDVYGGCVFKHTGDGMCAAFTSPRSAVDAAVAAQRQLELPVRMGLATGEAELRDGDYFGAVLNQTARVMAAGHGGQILVADSTAGLIRGVELIDLGPRRLRDLSTPVHLFQVQASGLRSDFPALRALDSSRGNLRRQTTTFIGRESEASRVQAALKTHRLVTLTGVGGVGKTRLATEVAVRLADEFPDGAWFFELAAVTDPAAVPDAVAAVLGITQQSGKTMTESVASALEGRVRLLVFDNCEHVVDSVAELVEAILAASATVTILATSREGLGVSEEQLWGVPSLDVNSGTDSAAVTLFVDRARSVVTDFSLTQPDAMDAVVEICRRLDGIPLAIELAASRMASMTAGEVRDRLDQRFRLLVGARRGLSRHQTLRHAVAWSYEHLDDAERALLERCSVFAGGFDLQSACAVMGSGDDYAVLDLLDALVHKSLLVADRSSGRTRYSMLETIRQFAEDQLVVRGEAPEIRATHSKYFAGREDDIMALWDSPRQHEAYAWFSVELANLRTAFRWAADQADLDTAAAIAAYAALLGALVANYEPMAWAEELIEPARAVDHPRLASLYVNAAQCYWTGRIEEAVGHADAGQTVIGSGGEVQIGAEGALTAVYPFIGQPERNVDWCRTQLARGRDTHTVTQAMLVVGLAVAGAGEEARAAANGLVDAAEATHNPWALANGLYAYGFAFRDADPTRALEALRRGLVIAQDSGSRAAESLLSIVLSRLEAEHGDPLAALDHITLAIRNFYDAGNVAYIRFALATLAVLLDRLGRLGPAAIIAAFAFDPLNAAEVSTAITHLCDVLGDQSYESLTRKGKAMTIAEMVTYAYEQIDQARTELTAAASK
ncbi:adenylate/guanylate cyclase domain-containing protein [Mycobacterium sp. 852014-50255_SCH5639931]|uniref:ATP-binding protein n=1 Tax=Mycobacterium sp. 852014-50255_SCH5639931 TaxID=1834112 RepID=UPI0007FEB945|nr:adenylate/guanylate cyclase domain-containing protein [Mycobacterium sp. 852014-50255_SCH5639931]OBB67519.1 cyclase [Mycobacterium sp. 852014-50255_SCH5639931]